MLTGKKKRETPEENMYGSRLDGRHFRFKTEDGSTPQSRGYSGGGGMDSYTLTLNFAGVKSKILSVEVVMETQLAEDKFDWELKDIPLPK
jgi:hypothetical protein